MSQGFFGSFRDDTTGSQAAQMQGPKATDTVARYLNTRLAQIGVTHVFAIPGDYIADYVNTLDEPYQNPGNLVRVHPNNEVTATYAADGNARAAPGRVGCVCFTYGVGALNAVQAMAGANVESVPVVLINGSPSIAQYNSTRDRGTLYHHMLDGGHTDQKVYDQIVAMTVRIDNPANAPQQIDAALRTCITNSKPVYIELSEGTAVMPCEKAHETPLVAMPVPPNTDHVKAAANAIAAKIRASDSLVFLAGSEISRFQLENSFLELLKTTKAPYVTSPLGKSVLDEGDESVRFSGVYFGKSAQQNVQDLVHGSDCLVCLGVSDTDFNFLGVTGPDYANPAPGAPAWPSVIQVRHGSADIDQGYAYWGDVSLKEVLAKVSELLQDDPPIQDDFPGLASGTPWDITKPERVDAKGDPIAFDDQAVSYDGLKYLLETHLLPGLDEKTGHRPTIVADSGFSFLAMSNLKVPQRGYVAQLAWAAIGYGVGATSGVGLAQPDRPIITVTGDAAFAETVNAIGTIAQLEQEAILFLIDNKVYAVEQWLVNANAFCPASDNPPAFEPMTEIPQGHIWDYVKIAEGFGGIGMTARTNEELRAKMDHVLMYGSKHPKSGKPTFTLIALEVDKTDYPSIAQWKLSCGPS